MGQKNDVRRIVRDFLNKIDSSGYLYVYERYLPFMRRNETDFILPDSVKTYLAEYAAMNDRLCHDEDFFRKTEIYTADPISENEIIDHIIDVLLHASRHAEIRKISAPHRKRAKHPKEQHEYRRIHIKIVDVIKSIGDLWCHVYPFCCPEQDYDQD